MTNSEPIYTSEILLKMLDNSPIPKAIMDENGKFEFLNKNFIKTLGYSLEDIPTLKEWWILAYPDEYYRENIKTDWLSELEQAIKEDRETKVFEVQVRCKDCKDRFFSISGKKILNKIYIVLANLTERKKLEDERYKFFNHSTSLMAIAGSDGYFKDINFGWTEKFGWSIHELKSKPFFDFIHPEDIEPTSKEVEKLTAGIKTINFTNRYIKKDGDYLWLKWIAVPYGDIFYCSATDITELINTQHENEKMMEELKQNESRYRGLYYYSPASIWLEDWTEIIEMVDKIKDSNINNFTKYFNENREFVDEALNKVKILDVNQETLRMFNAENKNQLMESLNIVFATEDTLPGFIGELSALAEGKTFYETEMALNTVDGAIINTMLRMTFPVPGDTYGRVIVSIMDLSKLKQAQKEKEDQWKKFKSMLNEFPEIMYVVDPHTYEIVFINKHFLDLLGYDPTGKKCFNEFQGFEAPCSFCTNEIILNNNGEPYVWEYRNEMLKKDYLITDKIIKWPDGRNLRFEIAIDITAQKESEIKLNESLRKLEESNKELEKFAYVASHDLQEPLRMVSSYTQLIEKKYNNLLDDKGREYIFYASDGATRMQMLLNDLLDYSRLSTTKKEFKIISLSDALWEATTNLKIKIDENLAIINSDPLPEIWGNKNLITRLLQNILDNSIKYRSENNPLINISYKLQEYNLIQVTVEDNGIGFDQKYADKVFVIFQRLHKRDKFGGTGIGLSICKKIVDLHGGKIWVISKEGVGTKIHFTLKINSEDPNE